DYGVFGDVYVSSYTFGKRPGETNDRDSPTYPVGGFIISREFEAVGGPEALFNMCARCPANTASHEVAGCFGLLHQRPDSPATEEQIRGIIARLGLEAEFHDAFPATTPLWYGLWAVSPVPRNAIPLLRSLISAMLEEDRREMAADQNIDYEEIANFARFVRAAEIAERENIDLEVQLLPPKHTSLGIRTIFPHCPFCKAAASTARWQTKYPDARQKCHVCGTDFSPSETAGARRMKVDTPDLRDLLGEAAFRRFACEYLIHQGETPASAAAIVVETEAEQRGHRLKRKRQAELARRKEQYLREHIYSGLATVTPPPSHIEDDEPKESQYFDAQNFAEVLRRALAAGIPVSTMLHRSSNNELDRDEWKRIVDPIALFERWKSEGCRGKFCAWFNVPETLLESPCVEPERKSRHD
ncbi:MAG: hypothetical protein V4710_14220, partial [Verrucomicrobiota bacterium]